MTDYGAVNRAVPTSSQQQENDDERGNLLSYSGPNGPQILHHSYSDEGDRRGGAIEQTSGEDTASQSAHQRTNSWTGVLSNFATDIFGGDNSHSNSNNTIIHSNRNASAAPPRPPGTAPPPPRPRRHTLERDYHLRNQQFLQQAANLQQTATQRAYRERKPYASPSPNTKFRKRLKAIEEDSQQSVVRLNSGSPHSRTASLQETPPDDHFAPRFYDSDELTTIRWQENDDNSVISSLAGSYCGGGAIDYYTTNTILNANDAERLAKFEQEQEERFQQKKQDMEAKLSKVLAASPIKREEDRKEFINSYMQQLELERAALMAQWKAEIMMEHGKYRQQEEDPMQRLMDDCYEALIKPVLDSFFSFLANVEVVLSNMPLTIGAVGLSWVTMGVVWFKFMEELLDSCQHVWYFSKNCTFQEFPGCFECDVNNHWYKTALSFHYMCSAVSGIACLLFIFKVILAPDAVWDMMKNPTTSTPAGVWCIAMVCTFAGQHGTFGETIVLITASFHVLLAISFLYMAFFKFHLWPDPGWFPNVVGISYAAVKTWIYFPEPGLVVMMLCTVFFLATFFVSVIRVYYNPRIAAPVCWIQLSAPSITLYALTLVSQPTQQQELLFERSEEARQQYDQFLITYYLPAQHVLAALTMLGLFSAVHSLWVRWPNFKTKPFSPAHIAFCFPTLSHTNAIQAYRATINSLSSIPSDSLFKKALFCYWCLFLVLGTVLNIIFTIKYIRRIPQWTKVDVTGEEPPPPPSQTIVQGMIEDMNAHETLKQSFVSPAVLEANEAGVLVRVKRNTEQYRLHGPFVRTRLVSSIGFDLILSEIELREERTRLLEWTATHAPRRRHRTMSDFLLHLFGSEGGEHNVYGTFQDQTSINTPLASGHSRRETNDV